MFGLRRALEAGTVDLGRRPAGTFDERSRHELPWRSRSPAAGAGVAVLSGPGAVPAVRPSGPRGARRRPLQGGSSSLRSLDWPPLVDGALPAFLASQRAYDGARYRVLYRPYVARAVGKAAASRGWRRSRGPSRCRGGARSSTAAPVAVLLAAEHACMVRFGETVAGGYYAFGEVARRAPCSTIASSSSAASRRASAGSSYSPASGLSPTQFVAEADPRRGCKNVMLYLVGGGYSPQNAINIGMGERGGDVLHQDVTLAQLHSLMSAQRETAFELVIDAAHASGFQALSRLANVLFVATPARPSPTSPRCAENDPLVRQHRQPAARPAAHRSAGLRDRSGDRQPG